MSAPVTVTLTARVSPEVRKTVQKLAKRKRTSVAQLTRLAVERYLEVEAPRKKKGTS
jgi:hypothetical protein